MRDILKADPGAAARSAVVRVPKVAWPVWTSPTPPPSRPAAAVAEPYTYPLHLALRRGVRDPGVAELLVQAAPAVLRQGDGEEGGSCWSGGGGDTPLHVACAFGAPLRVVRLLARAHPPAVRAVNFDAKTPLDLSRERAATCPGNVATYLHAAFGSTDS